MALEFFCCCCSKVLNPADDSRIGRVPDMSEADTEKAIGAAFKAFQSWKTTTAKVCSMHCCFWYL